MPPFTSPSAMTPASTMRLPQGLSPLPPQQQQQQQQARDVSSLHPVFFTLRLQRTPFPTARPFPLVPGGGGGGSGMYNNPVTHGYMYHETRRRAEGSSVPRL
ncbi:hypothetical protein MN608_03399 [Microdochium nivale]|nr:hypothetical protein MN608_03399 [Microdochium nivale]